MLSDWSTGDAVEPIFSGLANRTTSMMMKKDLERAGIPYHTDESLRTSMPADGTRTSQSCPETALHWSKRKSWHGTPM